ncbi:MAG: class I SAM-dependent methyltransferase [Actinomycetia bacterium]|nr:class I SAM-dependent methyltransferase [Actinomycetes bacterium]MCP5035894.1 class I SAM-dependent methyltransferase [Actinomycetes bacterium]
MSDRSNEVDLGWLTDPDGGHDTPAAIADYYDRWAGAYDTDLVAWDYRAPTRAASLLRTYAPQARRVLDAGCGTGMAGAALRQAGFDGELHGIDISQASLDLTTEHGAYQDLKQANLRQRLDIGDDNYDALLCVGVMTYVPEVRQCWTELCRVVAPGGVVVVTQRADLWRDRDCQGVIAAMEAGGGWELLLATDAEPYLPDSPGDLGALDVHYVVARVLA